MTKTLFGKLLLVIAFGVFLRLQYSLWFGEDGVHDMWMIKKAIAAQQKENEALKDRNRVLEAEVKDLKVGLEAVEEHGRQDLGMIKQNETFYLVTGNPDAQKDSAGEIKTPAPNISPAASPAQAAH